MTFDQDALAAAWAQLPENLGWHVLLSLTAIALGVAISLPLAIFAARNDWVRRPALAIASIVQTIPGLAMLALFYPILLALSAFTRASFGFGFPALGFLPALAALTLYSMLPVLRNTVAGLIGLDRAVLLAARAVGMTRTQSLLSVELPLAAPVILAGIRTAAVWVIGTATLSTPVGQTSLGNYIFTGLQTENWILVLFGCAAAAVLALAVDRLLGLAEDGVVKRSRLRVVASALGLALLVGASLIPFGRASETARIIIGNKGFDEQYILSALIERRLERAGFATSRRDGLGSTVIFDALTHNDVDIYVDYSGTVWFDDMKRRDLPPRNQLLHEMVQWLDTKKRVGFAGALGFENAYAFAMRADKAAALHIVTLADLARYAPSLKIGGDFEVFSRPEWRSVVETYGLKFKLQRQYQPTFMYRALLSGDVDIITAFSSDGRIAQYGLKLLSDPKGALPPYDAVVLVSPARAHDERLLGALTPLAGAIDLGAMQHANLEVDRDQDKRSPEAVGGELDAMIMSHRR